MDSLSSRSEKACVAGLGRRRGRALWRRFAGHFTAKHAGWLNAAGSARSSARSSTTNLLRLLQPDDVVVTNNLGAHHATGIRAAIEGTGAQVLYMPAYSPDLNAIEYCLVPARFQRSGARSVTPPSSSPRRTLWDVLAQLK